MLLSLLFHCLLCTCPVYYSQPDKNRLIFPNTTYNLHINSISSAMLAFGVLLILVAKVNIIGTSDSSEITPYGLYVCKLSRVLFCRRV